MLKNFKSLAALAVGLFLLAGLAQAAPVGAPNTTYYVSATTGNDANNATTPATPAKTIMAVMNAIRNTALAYNTTNFPAQQTNYGCTVKVAAGTYAENVIFPTTGTTLMGGYTADFSSRDWKVNQSVIDPNAGPNLGYTVGFNGVAKRHQCIILNAYTPNGANATTPPTMGWLSPTYCTVDGFKLVNGGPGETQNQTLGGGVYAYGATNLVLKNLEIANCDVSQSPTNTPGTGFLATGVGGGIYMDACNIPTLDNIEVHDCQIRTTSTTGALGGTPTAFNAQTGQGAGIYLQRCSNGNNGPLQNTLNPVSLTNLNIHDNFGGNGLSINCSNNSAPAVPTQNICYFKIWDCKFWNCVCYSAGGGMYIYNGNSLANGSSWMATIGTKIDMKRCWFYNDTANNGAAIYCNYSNQLSLTDSAFSNCKSEAGQGGLLFNGGNGTLTLDRCTFLGCWNSSLHNYTYPRSAASDYAQLAEEYNATPNGSCIELITQGSTALGTTVVRNCAVVGNRSPRDIICFNGNGDYLMSNMTVDHNYGKGDALVCHQVVSKLKFANSLYTNNVPGIGRRSYDAAVIRSNVPYNQDTLTFDRCVFQNNYFTSGSFHNGGPGTIANTAIVYYTTVTSMGVPVYLRPIIGVLSSAASNATPPIIPQPAGETYVPIDARGVIYTGDHLPSQFWYGGVNNNFDAKPYYVQDGAGATTGTWTAWSDTCARFGQTAPATASHWGVDFFLRTANTMTLTDANANFTPGALVGRYLFPVDPDKRLMNPYPYAGGANRNKRAAALILANTDKTITCTGRLEDFTTQDQSAIPPLGAVNANMPPDYAIETTMTGMPYKICDYHLQAISPAVDAGDNNIGFTGAGLKDLANNRRFAGNIDIGAYELVGPNAIGNHWTLFQ